MPLRIESPPLAAVTHGKLPTSKFFNHRPRRLSFNCQGRSLAHTRRLSQTYELNYVSSIIRAAFGDLTAELYADLSCCVSA
jgi:hypothetical protein